MIKRVVIHNYKLFDDFELDLNDDLNIIVGDNESGKSTILESINLALTRRLNGRSIENELSPFLFNNTVAKKFLADLKSNSNPALPEIFVELYFDDIPDLASFRGNNNSKHEDEIGIRLEIIFDEDFSEEYEELSKDKSQIKFIPIEYYKINWRSFADGSITLRGLPIRMSFIDAATIRLQSGADYYLQNIINSGLEDKDKAKLALAYRKLKEDFAGQQSISAINESLDSKKGAITDKQLTIALDVSQRTNWEANLVPHLDDLPSQYSGQGEQNSLKIMLALDRKVDETNIILIEEPENHLSYSSMNKLLKKIQERCNDKQIIIATHSSFVLNKLGLEKLILINNGEKMCFEHLPSNTQKYFKIMSGYDTLRLILSKRAILVEGPSDELIVQKAYLLKHGKLPIEEGVDILNVRGLSFGRFLDIAKELKLNVTVITDNDGNYKKKIEDRYKSYKKYPNIKIFYDEDDSTPTLEPQIVKCNDMDVLNKILGVLFKDKDSMIDYMRNYKTEYALKLFETSNKKLNIPQYIKDAIS